MLFHIHTEIRVSCSPDSEEYHNVHQIFRELQLELRETRRAHHLWKERQITWGGPQGYCEVIGEKIRRAKAKLELNLATSVKDKRKVSLNALAAKKKMAKGILYSLLDAGDSTVSGDEENTEILNVFFASVFNTNPVVLRIPCWKLLMGSWVKLP